MTLLTDVDKAHPLVLEGAQRAWNFKNFGCADHEHFDIVPIAQFFKDGALIVELLPEHVSRDNGLAIVDIVTGPTRADLVVLNVDAHVTRSMTNPTTGEAWKQGEMQGLCDNEGACATGLLTDCIASIAVFRDGHNEMIQRRYTGHETKGALIWQEPDYFGNDDGMPVGYVTERLTYAMTNAPQPHSKVLAALSEVAAAEGLTEGEAYWHEVMAGCHLAALTGAAAGILAFPPKEFELLVATSLTEERMRALAESPLALLAGLLAVKLGVE